MRVLLISCYELGHQPFALASAAAHLLDRAHVVECLDLAVERLEPANVQRAELVGISIPMHTAIRLGVKAGALVREMNPNCHICYFGLYASLNEEYLLSTTADSVIGGEYESPLWVLADALSQTGSPSGEGVSIAGRRSPPNLSRQQFLTPARHLLPPLEKYARLRTREGELRLVGYVEASRGCAHRCRHCPIPAVYEGRFRIVQEQVVLDDIDNLVRMGAAHITFGDPDFLNGVTHSLRIVRAMRQRNPALSFDFTAKIEHLIEHREAVLELGALGCVFIQSAVESVDADTLRYMDKGHTRDDVVEALAITGEAGVTLRPSLLPFTPWTTLQSFLELLEFVEEHDLIHSIDAVQYSIRLLLPPGSWLLRIAEIQPFVGELVQEDFVYGWTHPDPRVDALQADIARVAEEAVGTEEDPTATFYRIKDRTLMALLGRTSKSRPRRVRPAHRAPGLTEAWFC